MPTRSRRFPRFRLDLDWFVASAGASAMGRGLELSLQNALLPVQCTSPFASSVTLHLAFASRPSMFRARCSARQLQRGWLLTFEAVSTADLSLLMTELEQEPHLRARSSGHGAILAL